MENPLPDKFPILVNISTFSCKSSSFLLFLADATLSNEHSDPEDNSEPEFSEPADPDISDPPEFEVSDEFEDADDEEDDDVSAFFDIFAASFFLMIVFFFLISSEKGAVAFWLKYV